jgi:hypothetical protein
MRDMASSHRLSTGPVHLPCAISLVSRRRLPRVLGLGLALAGVACVAERKTEPLPGNLLAGATVETSGVPHTDRLVDGKAAQEGDFWDTAVSARFDKPDAHVTWDLGQAKPIRCALVQGDNNDSYLLSGSLDGKDWKPLWEGGPTTGAGMRLRQGKMEGNARYVRLTASGGDRLYSVGEVAVFSECPAGWPKLDLPRAEAVDPSASPAGGGVWTVSLGLFAIALVVFIVLTRRRSEPPRIDPPPPDDVPMG